MRLVGEWDTGAQNGAAVAQSVIAAFEFVQGFRNSLADVSSKRLLKSYHAFEVVFF